MNENLLINDQEVFCLERPLKIHFQKASTNKKPASGVSLSIGFHYQHGTQSGSTSLILERLIGILLTKLSILFLKDYLM